MFQDVILFAKTAQGFYLKGSKHKKAVSSETAFLLKMVAL